MTTLLRRAGLRGFVLPLVVALCAVAGLPALEIHETVRVGYANDVAAGVDLRLSDISPTLGLFATVNLEYVYQFEAGEAADARQIFINDNQGDIVEENGNQWLFGVTLGSRIRRWNEVTWEGFVGFKRSRYHAYFEFVGDNEAFTVSTHQFGFGAGSNLLVDLGCGGTHFVATAGLDWFLRSRIDAHGTYYYTPDDSDSNPRNTFDYADAADSINEPRLRPYASIGFMFALSPQSR